MTIKSRLYNWATLAKQQFVRLGRLDKRTRLIIAIACVALVTVVIGGLVMRARQSHERHVAYELEQASKLDDKRLTVAVNDLLQKKEYKQAADLIAHKAKYPNDKAVLLLKGDVQQSQGDLKGAVQTYQQVNKQYGATTEALLSQAQIEYRLGHKQQALQDYKLAAAKLRATPTLDAQTSLKNLQPLIDSLEK